MNMHKREDGFGHLLVFVLIVLAAVGAAGYWVWVNRDSDERTTATLEEPAEPCEGRLYDSHAHPDDDAVVERLPELMSEYDIGCSVLFTQMDINDIDTSLLEARERYSGMPGRISIFYDVITDSPAEVTREKLDDLYQKSGGEFNGLGEFAFYEESFQGTELTDEGWPVIFQFAADKDLAVMIHPQADMVGSLEQMLERYPDTKVIVHGFELPDEMPGLLKDHPNLYFTLDTATMFVLGELTPESIPQHLFYPGGGPNTDFVVDTFVADYDRQREEIVSMAVDKWLPVLLAAPKKVMWGTDISLEGHVDEAVYSRVIDLTNAFADKVPQQYRQAYLRDNAFNLLGEGNTLEALTDAEFDQLDSSVDEDDDSDNDEEI